MAARKWHSGPPPSIGWWPASVDRDHTALRYWNGGWWSDVARAGWSLRNVIAASRFAYPAQFKIEWSARWWEEKK